MRKLRKLRAALATMMAAAMFMASMPIAVVQAEMVPTDRVVDRMEIDTRRAEIASFLSREVVSRKIAAMGVTQDEAEMRVASMTDAEILQVSSRIENLPAGQAGVAEALIGAALLIFIVLLVTDLMGMTDIFPFVKGGNVKR